MCLVLERIEAPREKAWCRGKHPLRGKREEELDEVLWEEEPVEGKLGRTLEQLESWMLRG